MPQYGGFGCRKLETTRCVTVRSEEGSAVGAKLAGRDGYSGWRGREDGCRRGSPPRPSGVGERERVEKAHTHRRPCGSPPPAAFYVLPWQPLRPPPERERERDDHPHNVFSSMETIMTSVLEESDDISSDLLSSLLMSVKKNNKNILPIARELAEKVIGNCALKLKPYLMEAIQSMGAPLDDYGKLVAFICKENLYVLEQNGIDVSGECLKYRYIRTVSMAATSTMGALETDTPHGEEDMMMVFSPTKTSPIMAVDVPLSPPIMSKEGANVVTEGMMMVFSPTNTSPPPDKEHPSTVETTCPAIPALVNGISETSESFPALGIEWPDNPQFQAGLGDQELADQLMRHLDRLLHVDPLLAIDDMRNQLERCTRGYHAFGCPKDVWMAKLTTIWKEFARLSAVQARKQKAQLMLQEEEEGLRHLEATRNEVQARAETVEGRAQELRGEAQTLLQRAREAVVEAVALRMELGELRSKIFGVKFAWLI